MNDIRKLSPRNETDSNTIKIATLLHRYGAFLTSRWIFDVPSLYTFDANLSAPEFPHATGRAPIMSLYERIFSTIELDVELRVDNINVIDEENAFAQMTLQGTRLWLDNGMQEKLAVREDCFLRRLDRDWEIASHSFRGMKPAAQNTGYVQGPAELNVKRQPNSQLAIRIEEWLSDVNV